MRAKGRLCEWDRAVANNAKEFPDPKLPTYKGLPEWAEAATSPAMSRSPGGMDYVKHTIAGFDVDPTTVVVLS